MHTCKASQVGTVLVRKRISLEEKNHPPRGQSVPFHSWPRPSFSKLCVFPFHSEKTFFFVFFRLFFRGVKQNCDESFGCQNWVQLGSLIRERARERESKKQDGALRELISEPNNDMCLYKPGSFEFKHRLWCIQSGRDVRVKLGRATFFPAHDFFREFA
jgi:hypothetical protein